MIEKQLTSINIASPIPTWDILLADNVHSTLNLEFMTKLVHTQRVKMEPPSLSTRTCRFFYLAREERV